MTYLNLLYRQKSFAYLDEPDQWQRCVDQATEWRDKTIQTMGKASASAAPPEAASEERSPSEPTVDEGAPGATNHRKK
jgi:hypothetical protein